MRPEGFKNPYEPVGANLKKMGNQIAFEAGADHMVELLRKYPNVMYRDKCRTECFPHLMGEPYVKGYWVFIEDEE